LRPDRIGEEEGPRLGGDFGPYLELAPARRVAWSAPGVPPGASSEGLMSANAPRKTRNIREAVTANP
jgi:hypothetical protein